MNIHVAFNGFNYDAHDMDSYDGAPDSRQNIIGYGSTEANAISDLYEKMDYMQCDNCAGWMAPGKNLSFDVGDEVVEMCCEQCCFDYETRLTAAMIDSAELGRERS